MPVLTVEKPLRDSLKDDAAVDALVHLINQAQDEQKKDILEFVEEKFERRLSEEISQLDVRLSQKISDLEVRLSQKIADSNAKLSQKIADSSAKLSQKVADSDVKTNSIKAELIKWMFIFWVGQIGVILGFMFAFFKK